MYNPQTIVAVRSNYTFRRWIDPRWYYRLRWWFVRKLGGRCPLDAYDHVRITIDHAGFLQYISAQYKLAYSLAGRPPTRVIIGHEDWMKFKASPSFNQYVQFNLRDEFLVMDMAVEIVPWLKGVAVLP